MTLRREIRYGRDVPPPTGRGSKAVLDKNIVGRVFFPNPGDSKMFSATHTPFTGSWDVPSPNYAGWDCHTNFLSLVL